MKIVILYLSIIIIFNSCVSFKNPIDSVENAVFDSNLLGSWEISSENEMYKVLFLNKSTPLYQIIMYDDKYELQLETTYIGYLSKVNDNVYLNISLDNGDFLFYLIEIGKDKLVLNSIDMYYIMDLIDYNKLLGDYDKMGAMVESTSEQIRSIFIDTNSKTLFPDELKMTAQKMN